MCRSDTPTLAHTHAHAHRHKDGELCSDHCQAEACKHDNFCFFHMNTDALHVSTRRLATFQHGRDPTLHTPMHYGRFLFVCLFLHCISTLGCFHTYSKLNVSTADRQAQMRWPDELDGGCNEVWARCGVMPCGDATWVNGQQITDIDAAVQKTTTEYTAFQERTRQEKRRGEGGGQNHKLLSAWPQRVLLWSGCFRGLDLMSSWWGKAHHVWTFSH